MAGWKAIGPFGGSALIVQADPFHADTIVAATSNAMVFRSTDAGATWQSMRFPVALQGILRTFVIEPSKPDTYLAGVSGQTPDQSGLLRSEDAGKSWQSLPGLRGKDVWSIAVWKGDPKVIAAGTGSGVYLSHDDGETWKLISDPMNREMPVIVSLSFDPKDSNTIYAGTPHLALKTTNGGGSWHPIHAGMLDDSDVFSINADPTRTERVFASACSGIYHTENAGAAWHKAIGAKGASYRTYFVSRDPREEETVFAGTTHGLVKSTDGGNTFRQLSTHQTRYVAFDPHHPKRIYVATDDDGIERSDDEGETLVAMNAGFCNRQLTSLTSGGKSLYTHTIYEGESGGIFRIMADQERWEKIAPAPRLKGEQLLTIVPDQADPSRWFGAAYNSIVLGADDAKRWNSLIGFPKTRINDLFVAPKNAYLLSATESGLFRSADAGKTWKNIPIPATKDRLETFFQLEDTKVAALAAHSLFVSTDGMLWQAAGSLPEHAETHGLVESGALFAATSFGLEQSDDGGKSWQLVRGGLPSSTVQAICKHPARPGVLVAAQYDGVFESQDNGKTWLRISPDEPRVSVRQLAILPEQANRVFVLTERQGIYVLPLEGTALGASN